MAPRADLAARTDQEIVVLARAGQEAAYRELIRRYERPLFSLLYRMVRDRELAEDLAQETFIKALNAIESYRPEYKFSSWIFKIANNAAIDHLRRRELDTLAARGDAGRGRGHRAADRRPAGVAARRGRGPGAGRADRASDRPAPTGVPLVHSAPSRGGPGV